MIGHWALGIEMGIGQWAAMDIGHCALSIGHWALGIGQWALGTGRRVLGVGHLALGIGRTVAAHAPEWLACSECSLAKCTLAAS